MTKAWPGLAQACQTIITALERLRTGRQRPLLVAIDGGSGAGKSTLAEALAAKLGAALVPLDDFFAAEITDAGWDARSPEERARDVLSWRRLRAEALEPLRAGRPARWHRFDFEAGQRADGTYGMHARPVACAPAPVIILDGAYSGHPRLADLVDLAVLVDVPVGERHRRLARREEAGFLERWHARWDAVEAYYFSQLRPRCSYDLVVSVGNSEDQDAAPPGHS